MTGKERWFKNQMMQPLESKYDKHCIANQTSCYVETY